MTSHWLLVTEEETQFYYNGRSGKGEAQSVVWNHHSENKSSLAGPNVGSAIISHHCAGVMKIRLPTGSAGGGRGMSMI